MTEQKKELSRAKANGVGWLESIKEMVAALECDYERLEDLREEREAWEPEEYEEGSGKLRPADNWAVQNPDRNNELKALEGACTIDGDEMKDADAARQRIEESPLSIQVRYPWISPGATDDMISEGPEEFEILLSTGGPALRIIGELDQHQQPDRARLQHQDFGTPWTDIVVTGDDYAALLSFCQVFYFG